MLHVSPEKRTHPLPQVVLTIGPAMVELNRGAASVNR
jgi:hypothetical protein